MSAAVPAASIQSRLSWGRLLAVLATTLLLHLAAVLLAQRGLDSGSAPPTASVNVQLFTLPQQITLAAAPPPKPRPPRAAPVVAAPAPPPAQPAPEAELAQPVRPEPATEPSTEAAPEPAAAESPAGAPADEASPLDAIVVSFPRYGRLISDTIVARGLLRVQGTTDIEWRATATTYEVRMDARDDSGFFGLSTASSGEIRPKVGIAPLRYTEKSQRRAEVAANFQWDAGKVTFSSSGAEFPLVDGIQDRLSFLAQLALLAEAFPDQFTPGATVAMKVAGVRDVSIYEMRVTAREGLVTPAGYFDTVRLERALAPGQREPRIELWMAPSLRWLPARTRTTFPNGDVAETLLREVQIVQ